MTQRKNESIEEFKIRYAAYQKAYRALPEVKTANAIYDKKRRAKPEYKAAIKEYKRIQRATNPAYLEAKRKRNAERQRNLGFVPINDWFHNSHAHHINHKQVIYIPTSLHRLHYGHRLDRPETMILINRVTFEYLTNTIKQIGE